MPELTVNIRYVQKILFITLKDVRDFCEKNNIKYFLYCGTLLGCIRHGGIIPWDDDVDIAMPLEDYKKFSKLIREDEKFNEKYNVIGTFDDTKTTAIWTKINRKNTVYYDKRYLSNGVDKGISLDIYPMIGEDDNKFRKKIQLAVLWFQRFLFQLDHNKFTKFEYIKIRAAVPILKLIAACPYSWRVHLIHFIKEKFWLDPEKTKRAGTIDSVVFAGKFEYKIWHDTAEREFQEAGEWFTIPENYDTMLRTMYGDYMVLPPEEKRTSNHMNEGYLSISEDVAEEAGIQI